MDARECGNGLELADNNPNSNTESTNSSGKASWQLHHDLAIFASGFESSKDFRIGADSPVNLWLITPDSDNSDSPSCEASKDSKIGGDTIVDDEVAALLYTPCFLELNPAMWRGQIYARNLKLDGSTLRYAPVGGSGVGPALWGNQTAVEGASATYLGERESIRDVG